jgi:hypothetical protein
MVAHIRQGRVAGVQDIGLQFGGVRANGGSVLLRCVLYSKYTIGGIEAIEVFTYVTQISTRK